MKKKTNTRTASGTGSIRQRPDGRWEGRLIVGYDPGTGKPIRRSIYGDTQKAVRQEMTSIQRALDNGTYQPPTKLTVGAWLDMWMETFCASTVKPLTYSAYETSIKNHIKPAIGVTKLQSLKGVDIQRMYNTMIASGLAPKTVKNTSAILHKALQMAIKQGYIRTNPCDAAELPKADKKEITPLQDAEIPQFLDAIAEHPMGNAYALCLFAGLREGECLGLSWRQVDFENKVLLIDQQLQKEKGKNAKYYIAPTTKNSKPRRIAPPEIAFHYLRAERLKQIANRLAAGALWDNPDDLVFTNSLGRHYAIHTFYKISNALLPALAGRTQGPTTFGIPQPQ